MAKSFAIKRIETFMGKQLRGGESANYHIRLNTADKKWSKGVHETWEPNSEVVKLKNPLIHDSHDTIESFVRKLNSYTTINAAEKFKNKIPFHWWNIILNPAAKFVQLYIFKQGYKDGTHGFVHAMLMSFHSYLTQGKLWLLYKHQKHTADGLNS